jgi:regulator of replication initiation timing
MRKNAICSVVLAMALGSSLTACEDTKARQENEQLKAKVAEVEKENTDLQGRVDALTKDNAALAADNEKLKAKTVSVKKSVKGKKHKRTAKRATS